MAEGGRGKSDIGAGQETDGAMKLQKAKRSSFLYRADTSPLLATLQNAAIKHPSLLQPSNE